MLSIIIPTLNEEKVIGNTLVQLTKQVHGAEIIVVDGGSQDRTIPIVQSFSNIQLIQIKKCNRGYQLHEGAKRAIGKYLLFLHADSQIDEDPWPAMEKILEELGCMAGTFRISFDQNKWCYKMMAKLANLNWSLLTFGDQGLFLRSTDYWEIGGFRNFPIMEDIDFVSRILNHGKMGKASLSIVTSARRFQRNGVLKQLLINIFLVFGYNVGIAPQQLKNFYSYSISKSRG